MGEDWPHRTLLFGYGSYGDSIVPAFDPNYIGWMELGGVLAVANIRGGGEYGEEWHLAGKTVKRHNSFDDFIAAAEWLIHEKRTTSKQLAIMGASTGSLLVGAVELQRPELFGACIPIGRRNGHASISDVHFRPIMVRRIRPRRKRGRVQIAACVLALPQCQGRRLLPAHAYHDNRH